MAKPEKRGCAALLTSLFGTVSRSEDQSTSTPILKAEKLPYHLTQAFLTPAEISFYHVLHQIIGDKAVICPKVSLGDLFYTQTGDRFANQTWRNKIDRKHVDFLLCDPKSMQPLLGIELDDASHQQESRQERDHFVERVFDISGLPLFRQPVRPSYNLQELSVSLSQHLGLALPAKTEGADTHSSAEVATPQVPPDQVEPITPQTDSVPACPICQQPMVLRTIKKAGPHYGQQFWGCQKYPQCRGMRPYQATQV